MTRISCGWDGEGFTIEAAGHSGYAERGKDLVCAGVSTLIFTTYHYLRKMQSEGRIGELEKREADGFVSISGRYAEGGQTITKTALELALTGFEMLAENYPPYVTVAGERVKTNKGEEKT